MGELGSIGLVLMVLAGVAAFGAVLARPFYGLLLVVVIVHLEGLGEGALPAGLSLGRVVGLVAAAGWIAHKFLTGRSAFVKDKPVFWLCGILLATSILGIFATTEWVNPVSGALRLAMLVLFCAMVRDLVTTRKEMLWFIWALALSTGIAVIVGVWQYRTFQAGGLNALAEGSYVGKGEEVRLAGLRDNPNEIAILLMCGIPFLYLLVRSGSSKMARLIWVPLLAGSILVMILTVSRVMVFAAILFFVIYVLLRAWQKSATVYDWLLVGGVMAAFVGAFAIAPDFAITRIQRLWEGGDGSAGTRLAVMQIGLELFLEHPFVGVGIGNTRYFSPIEFNSHDTLSCLLGEMGIVGGIVFAALCWVTGVRLFRSVRALRYEMDDLYGALAMVLLAAFIVTLATWFGKVIVFQRLLWICVAMSSLLDAYVRSKKLAPAAALPAASKAAPWPAPHALPAIRPSARPAQ